MFFTRPRTRPWWALRTLLEIPGFLGYASAIDAFPAPGRLRPSHGLHAERGAGGRLGSADGCCPASGLDQFPDQAATFWHRKQHVFNSAFYYFEYIVAQLFALQTWRRSRQDPAGASADLVKAMGLGGTVGVPDFFAAAGAEFRLDRGHLADLMEDLEKGIDDGLAALGQAPLPAA